MVSCNKHGNQTPATNIAGNPALADLNIDTKAITKCISKI